jgi:triosephosphate isomerase
MPRTPFVVGNWKMNTTKAQALDLAKAVARGVPNSGVQVGVAPPYVYIDAVVQAMDGSAVRVGAQDCSSEKFGAFTGEVSAEMLRDVGCKFSINGHSERRHVLHESSDLIARKAAAIYAGGLTLIHCVGETLEQRDSNRTLQVVEQQLDELDPSKMDDPRRLVIAYEPVWAIGTGRTATEDQAQQVHAFIRDTIASRWNADFAYAVRILYGGSMKPDNARGLMSRNDVDGGLIGGAALKAESFLAVVEAAV